MMITLVQALKQSQSQADRSIQRMHNRWAAVHSDRFGEFLQQEIDLFSEEKNDDSDSGNDGGTEKGIDGTESGEEGDDG